MLDHEPTVPIPGTEILVPSGAFRITLHCSDSCFLWVRNNGDAVSPPFGLRRNAQKYADKYLLV